jgi:hypothetical protein
VPSSARVRRNARAAALGRCAPVSHCETDDALSPCRLANDLVESPDARRMSRMRLGRTC